MPMDFRAVFDEGLEVRLSAAAYHHRTFWLARQAAALFLSRTASTAFLATAGMASESELDALEDLNDRSEQSLSMIETYCGGHDLAAGQITFLEGMVASQTRDLAELNARLGEDAAQKNLHPLDAWLAGVSYWGYWSFVLTLNLTVEEALGLDSPATRDRWRKLHEEIEAAQEIGARVATDSPAADDRQILAALHHRWSAFVVDELVPEVNSRLNESSGPAID
ncbi:MAG: hypothetical protein WD535_04760 [Thermaerobacterales bacterium]